MEHLVIPTRDYLFAPSIVDITLAVNFIHSEWWCACFLPSFAFTLSVTYYAVLLCYRECFTW